MFQQSYAKVGTIVPRPMVDGLPENKHGIINEVVDLNVPNGSQVFPKIVNIDSSHVDHAVTITLQNQSGVMALQQAQTLTANEILFANSTGLITQGATLVWLNTTRVLGVGKTVPTYTVDILGTLLVECVYGVSSLAVSNIGTPGADTYTYAVVAVMANGQYGRSSTIGTGTGNATLNGTNFNRLTWTDTSGATSYEIRRTQSTGTPASTGLIGTVVAGVQTFDDTGIAGDSTAVPTNQSGNVTILGDAVIFGNFSADAQTFTPRQIKVADSNRTDSPGESLEINGAMGNGTAPGGTITLTAGWDEANVGFGGEVFIASVGPTGDALETYMEGAFPVDGKGGDASIYAGSGSGTDKDGGNIILQPGSPTGVGAQGQVHIKDPSSSKQALVDTTLLSADRNFAFPDMAGTLCTFTSGSGVPGSTPSSIGQFYIDTLNAKVYASTGTTNAADWKILN